MQIEISLTFQPKRRRRRVAMPISRPVYHRLMGELTSRTPEAGGILIGPKDNRIVTHFMLDEAGSGTTHSFRVGNEWLNAQLEKFLSTSMDVKGIVHSHPAQVPHPSEGDRRYLVRLFNLPANDTAEFYFPIVCDGRLYPYIVRPASISLSHWASPARLELL